MFPGSLESKGNLRQRNIFHNLKQHLDAEITVKSNLPQNCTPLAFGDLIFGYEWCSECFRNMRKLL
jgi:hypothetical protein